MYRVHFFIILLEEHNVVLTWEFEKEYRPNIQFIFSSFSWRAQCCSNMRIRRRMQAKYTVHIIYHFPGRAQCCINIWEFEEEYRPNIQFIFLSTSWKGTMLYWHMRIWGRIQAKYTVHIFIIPLEEHNVVLTWECEEDGWALQYLSIGSPMMEKTGNGEYLRNTLYAKFQTVYCYDSFG